MTANDFAEIFTARASDLTWWQVGARTVLVYLLALLIVRAGKKRLFGKNTALDMIIAVVLGSAFSRSINGSATLLSSAVAGVVLIALHALAAKLTFRYHWLGDLLKGKPDLLVRDGKPLHEAMASADMSEHDLQESARLLSLEDDLRKIDRAYLERNGSVSMLAKSSPPKVTEVKVADGVQTVRIEVS